MRDDDRLRLLFGPYETPRFRYGDAVVCEARGAVVIAGLTDALIPWPVGTSIRPTICWPVNPASPFGA